MLSFLPVEHIAVRQGNSTQGRQGTTMRLHSDRPTSHREVPSRAGIAGLRGSAAYTGQPVAPAEGPLSPPGARPASSRGPPAPGDANEAPSRGASPRRDHETSTHWKEKNVGRRKTMRIKTLYVEHLAEWEHLLGSVGDDPSLADLVNQPKLRELLTRAQALRLKQAQLQAAKQATTQELVDVIGEGKDVSRDFKSELKSRIGSRSERLVQYQMLPLRKRVK